MRVTLLVRVTRLGRVTLVWGWPHTAAALLLGQVALLRPGELTPLRRLHIRPPMDDAGLERGTLVLCLVRPKTRYRAARL